MSGKKAVLGVVAFGLMTLVISTNSLAELNQVEKINTAQGYPYGTLVKRSDEVKIFYKETANNINCRTEILQNGELTKGAVQTISLKKFKQKPLGACLARPLAKKLLAQTY